MKSLNPLIPLSKKGSFLIIGCSLLITPACQSKAGTGALVGGGGGALIGGVVGGPQGALIGGAAGAVGGAIIGASIDQSDRRRMDQTTRDRYDRGEPATVSDVVRLTKRGFSDSKIVGYIEQNGIMYCPLSSHDKRIMKLNHVSSGVIAYMENSCDEY